MTTLCGERTTTGTTCRRPIVDGKKTCGAKHHASSEADLAQFDARKRAAFDSRDREEIEAILEEIHGAPVVPLVVDLSGHDFSGEDLSEADFRKATLSGANFQGAVLDRADFAGADLRGADFRKARILGANFAEADLRGADLRGTQLDLEKFRGSVVDETTKFPNFYEAVNGKVAYTGRYHGRLGRVRNFLGRFSDPMLPS